MLLSLLGNPYTEQARAACNEPVEQHSRYWSVHEMINLAYDAGFDTTSTILIVSIALAESGGFDGAYNDNPATIGCPGGSRDRGILQINDCYHDEVTDACAYDAACSFREAYRISYGGSVFSEWTTFNVGVHIAFMPRVMEIQARKRGEEWEEDP